MIRKLDWNNDIMILIMKIIMIIILNSL